MYTSINFFVFIVLNSNYFGHIQIYFKPTGLEISIGHWAMTDSNKCLTDLKLLQSDIVSERKIKTM